MKLAGPEQAWRKGKTKRLLSATPSTNHGDTLGVPKTTAGGHQVSPPPTPVSGAQSGQSKVINLSESASMSTEDGGQAVQLNAGGSVEDEEQATLF